MSGPLLIAYDGSDDAAHAIECAGRLLAPKRALVVHSFLGLSQMMLRSNVAVEDLDGPLAARPRSGCGDGQAGSRSRP